MAGKKKCFATVRGLRRLLELPDDMARKISIEFDAGAADALAKAALE